MFAFGRVEKSTSSFLPPYFFRFKDKILSEKRQ
jgi:hypothetical protein